MLNLVAGVITFIAFFVILFTKKYPDSLYNIAVMARRYQFRVITYAMFMREPLASCMSFVKHVLRSPNNKCANRHAREIDAQCR